jgi:hypothetical protein
LVRLTDYDGSTSPGKDELILLCGLLLFGQVGLGDVGLTALGGLIFALFSPLAVGVVAGVYLLSIRTFVGKVSSFREVYRMAAYAFGALILAWIPIVAPSPSPTPSSTCPSDKRSRLAFQVAPLRR